METIYQKNIFYPQNKDDISHQVFLKKRWDGVYCVEVRDLGASMFRNDKHLLAKNIQQAMDFMTDEIARIMAIHFN